MQKTQITKVTAAELEAALKSKEEYKIFNRLLCMLHIARGNSSREVEKLFYMSHNQICLWVKRLNEEGIRGLYSKVKPGRSSRINEEQCKKLRHTVLKETPNDYGFNTSTWTAPIIVKWLKSECNITYSDDAVYVLLKKKLNLTHIKGKGFYPESNPEKRKEFVEIIKKNSTKLMKKK